MKPSMRAPKQGLQVNLLSKVQFCLSPQVSHLPFLLNLGLVTLRF